jgi:mono/diheme cytochrome c family protein
MRRALWVPGVLLILAGPACDRDSFTQPLELGGVTVTPQVLNQGRSVYNRYCVGCHGREGDGKGPTAGSMVPPPRDFRSGSFKWSCVPGGKLPVDDDILRTLRHGLKGTHMPAFTAMPDEEARGVVQYLKTFSPRWRSERPGKPVAVPPDPWAAPGRRTEGVARGDAVYHVTAQCWACHPAYEGRARMQEMAAAEAKRTGKEPKALPFRSDLRKPLAVVTRHGRLLPPDFLSDTLRAADDQGDVYRTVAAGIGGTPMPSWSSELSAEDLWAVVDYVGELRRIKGTPEAETMRERAGQ